MASLSALVHVLLLEPHVSTARGKGKLVGVVTTPLISFPNGYALVKLDRFDFPEPFAPENVSLAFLPGKGLLTQDKLDLFAKKAGYASYQEYDEARDARFGR